MFFFSVESTSTVFVRTYLAGLTLRDAPNGMGNELTNKHTSLLLNRIN